MSLKMISAGEAAHPPLRLPPPTLLTPLLALPPSLQTRSGLQCHLLSSSYLRQPR